MLMIIPTYEVEWRPYAETVDLAKWAKKAGKEWTKSGGSEEWGDLATSLERFAPGLRWRVSESDLDPFLKILRRNGITEFHVSLSE